MQSRLVQPVPFSAIAEGSALVRWPQRTKRPRYGGRPRCQGKPTFSETTGDTTGAHPRTETESDDE